MKRPHARTPAGRPANAEDLKQRADILPAADLDRKRVATLQAHAAMCGIQVQALGADLFIVSRWAHNRTVEGLDELERLLKLQGVRL